MKQLSTKSYLFFFLPALMFIGCEQQYLVSPVSISGEYLTNPAVYVAGRPIRENRPTLKAQHFSISPALVDGLDFDPATGGITGTPIQLSGPKKYLVTVGDSDKTIPLTLSVIDGIAPVITRFEVPATVPADGIAIEAFEATDDFEVTGYCVTSIDRSSTCSWLPSPQTAFAFNLAFSPGVATEKSLFAFARDAAGNISDSRRADIAVMPPVPGACGEAAAPSTTKPTSGLCSSGANTAPAVAGSGPWTWTCEGVFGAASASCKAELLGQCGAGSGIPSLTAPSAALCASGTPSSVTGTGPWAWSCLGSTSTLSAACAAPQIINGACGSANGQHLPSAPSSNLCSSGTASTVSGTGPWSWNCNGANTGSNASCSAHLKIDGACGSSHGQNFSEKPTTNLCSTGAVSAVVGTGPWNWSCNVTTGSNANCFANLIVNGACGSANGQTLASKPTTNLCAAGTASSVSGAGPWSWSCSGLNSGSTATCSANPALPLSATITQIEVGNQVILYVTVNDPSGNPVTGLSASNFSLTDNGLAQGPLTVSTTGTVLPVSIVLDLDYSGSMSTSSISALKSAATTFVDKMGASDEAEIIKFSSTVEVIQTFTADRALLKSKIQALPNSASGSTAFFDSIGRGLSDISLRSNPRKAIIAMTDGYENASKSHTESTVTSAAQCGQVAIHTVGLGSVDQALLQRLATNTGGVYHYAPAASDLTAIYEKIAGVINSQYVISYSSSVFPVPTSRTISIAVSAPGFASTTASKTHTNMCSQ